MKKGQSPLPKNSGKRIEETSRVLNNVKLLMTEDQLNRFKETGTKPTIKQLKTELAEYLGFGFDMVHFIYANYTGVSIYHALLIAEYYNVTVDEVFYLNK